MPELQLTYFLCTASFGFSLGLGLVLHVKPGIAVASSKNKNKRRFNFVARLNFSPLVFIYSSTLTAHLVLLPDTVTDKPTMFSYLPQ